MDEQLMGEQAFSETRRVRFGKMNPVPVESIIDQCAQAADGNCDHVVPVNGMLYLGKNVMSIDQDNRYVMDDFSWNQLAKHLKGRLTYWDLFPDTAIDSSSAVDVSCQAQINYLLHNSKFEDKEMLIRGNDNTGLLRAYLGPRYGKINNLEVLQAVDDLAPDRNFGLQAVGYAESRKGFYLTLADEDDYDIGEPGHPDIWRSGIRIINSEVGFRKLMIMCFFWRLLCVNGAVIIKLRGRPLSRKHTGSLDHDTMINFLGDSINTLLETKNDAYPAMKRAKSIMIPVDEENTVELYIHRTLTDNALPASAIALVQAAYNEEPIPSRYFIGQAMTRAAQLIEDEDIRHNLEVVGGQYLTAA